MKKKLVEVNNLESYICQANGTIHIDKSMILTPGAKDALKTKNICIVYGDAPENFAKNSATSTPEISPPLSESKNMERLFYGVAAMVKEEYGIDDPGALKEISCQIIATLKKSI